MRTKGFFSNGKNVYYNISTIQSGLDIFQRMHSDCKQCDFCRCTAVSSVIPCLYLQGAESEGTASSRPQSLCAECSYLSFLLTICHKLLQIMHYTLFSSPKVNLMYQIVFNL